MNPQAAKDVDPGTCPLCGGANRCAMDEERRTGTPQAPCWCTQASFAPSLIAQVPAAARDLACICGRCASANPDRS